MDIQSLYGGTAWLNAFTQATCSRRLLYTYLGYIARFFFIGNQFWSHSIYGLMEILFTLMNAVVIKKENVLPLKLLTPILSFAPCQIGCIRRNSFFLDLTFLHSIQSTQIA